MNNVQARNVDARHVGTTEREMDSRCFYINSALRYLSKRARGSHHFLIVTIITKGKQDTSYKIGMLIVKLFAATVIILAK